MKLSKLIAIGIMTAIAFLPSAGHAGVGDARNQIGGSDCTIGDETLVWDSANVQWNASASIKCATAKPSIDVRFAVQELNGATLTPVAITGPTVLGSQNPNGTDNFSCADMAPAFTAPCKQVVATGAQPTLDPNRLYVMTTSGYIIVHTIVKNKPYDLQINGKHTMCFVLGLDTTQAPVAIPGCEG